MQELADKGRRKSGMASILIDGRHTDGGRVAFLSGLVAALRGAHADWRLTVALGKSRAWPLSLVSQASCFYLPHGAELFWPRLARGFDLFVSPAAPLPLLPMPCPMVHAVHELPSPGGPGTFRLRRALRSARLTWFACERERQACEAMAGRALAASTVHRPGRWDGHVHDLETVLGRR